MATGKQLIILLFGYLLMACSSEVDPPVPSPEPGEEKVRVSVCIGFDSDMEIRSGWEYEEYFPEITREEKIVSNVLLVVFKNEVLEEYAYYTQEEFVQDESDFSIILEDKGDEVLDLEPGPHYFYSILNLSSDMYHKLLSVLQGQEKVLSRTTFERQAVDVSLEYLTESENGFVMTNISPPVLEVIYSEDQIKEGDGLNNDIYIRVGRAAAKTSLAYVPTLHTGELHGSLSDIRYKVANNPGKMYLMPVIENGILLTPHYSNSVYPAGYFYPTVAQIENLPEEEWLPATTRAMIEAPEFEPAYAYCIENNNSNVIKSNSVMLLIKAVFTPAVWLDIDGNQSTPSSDGTFYRIAQYQANGELITYLQGYYNEAPYEKVAEANNNQGDADKAKGYYYDMAEYDKGITYYGFWLADDKKEHVVKRNAFHRVVITHIHGAGSPDPGGTIDPDIDPDDESTYGRIAVFLVSWNNENVPITVGEAGDDSGIGGSINPKPWEIDDQEKELGGDDKWN